MLTSIQYQLGEKLRRKVSVEDIFQDTWLDIVKTGIENFEFHSDNSFCHYVNKIITNNIKDEASKYSTAKRDVGREQSNVLVVADSELNFEFVERRPDVRPSFQLQNQENREFVLKLLDSLQDKFPDYSQPVFLRLIEMLPYDEISAELGITEGAARKMVTRGKEKLKGIYRAMKVPHGLPKQDETN
jgi:RNA polymerase sigma factor (sigma-70 family)